MIKHVKNWCSNFDKVDVKYTMLAIGACLIMPFVVLVVLPCIN